MEAYANYPVLNLLDDAFGKWDKEYDRSNVTIPFLDRADHIIIGGRTASELLVQQFEREFPNMKNRYGKPFHKDERNQAYGQFYMENGKRYINQMISSALANGETVEVYVPDKATGRIKDEPMKLTPTQLNPADPLVKPAQLTGWQRFWSKLGFYRREKAAVVNYERELAAREKVKFCNKAGRAGTATINPLISLFQAELEAFHPKTVRDMKESFPESNGQPHSLSESNGFKTNRCSFYSTVTLLLASKRDKNNKPLYTNEQLFDMDDPEMQKARADAMKEIYDHYKPGRLLDQEMKKKRAAEKKGETYKIDDKLVEEAAKAKDWLVDLQYKTADEIRDRITDQAGKLDFSRQDLPDQEGYREFALLSEAAFDLSQDSNVTEMRMKEKYGKDAYTDFSNKVGDCCQFSRRRMQAGRSCNGKGGRLRNRPELYF